MRHSTLNVGVVVILLAVAILILMVMLKLLEIGIIEINSKATERDQIRGGKLWNMVRVLARHRRVHPESSLSLNILLCFAGSLLCTVVAMYVWTRHLLE